MLKCIESVLYSEGAGVDFELEVVVCNNGSTDNTLEILNEIASRRPEVKVFSQENKGPAGSRQTCLERATGDYLAWCDSDDWVEPTWLSHMYANLKKYDADISMCRAIIDGSGTVYNPSEFLFFDREESIERFIKGDKVNGFLCNKMFRHSLFDGINFSLDMWYWEDAYVMWQVLQRVIKLVWHNEGTYHFVMWPTSMTHKRTTENRVYSTLKLWGMVVDDCRVKWPQFLSLAKQKLDQSVLSEIRKMFRDDLHHEEYETRIQQIVREGGYQTITALPRLKDKLFALAVMANLKMSRSLVSRFG